MTYTNSYSSNLDGRHLTEAAQRAMRQRVIEARKKGFSVIKIAEMLSMSRSWVYKVIASAKCNGEEAAVQGCKRGPKVESALKSRLLTRQQEKQLYDWIVDKDPRQFKFDWAVWTRKAVQDLVRDKFGVEMAIRTVSLYMERWGMTPQRPQKAATEQDPKEVQDWLEVTYPSIEKMAKKEKALIVWQDETSIKQDTNWVRSYAPRGHTPTVMHHARMRYGAPVMISAINNQGKCFFMFQRKAVNAFHFIRFLHRLILDLGKNKRKLFVICDNARIHHAKIVREWIAKHKNEIVLFFLPAYSPTRNPDEYMNRYVKTELRLRAPKTHDESLEFVRGLAESCRKDPSKVIKCFEPSDVQYARFCEAA